MATLEAVAVKSETLSPKEYLEALKKQRDNISSTHIEIARMGSNDFGKLRIEYNTPVYKVPAFGGN